MIVESENQNTMWAGKVYRFLDRSLKPVILGLFAFSGVALMAMMFIVAFDVGLRNAFNLPLPGSFDLTTYTMGIVVAVGVAYCAMEKAHIGTEVIVEKLPQKPKLILAAIVTFISFVFTGIITWQSFVNMKSTIALGLQSNILHIPVFPFLGIVGVCFLLYGLELLKDFFGIVSGEGSK
jgi:TRAP-type C4-dicarboxylate transport system permease small subunit